MRIHVVETHISRVFLTPERAYKIKKPVVMPFLDYRTLAARRRFCFEEVRLNRRLAPEVYVGVRALVRRADGTLALAQPEATDAVEYAVEMQRIPDEWLLASRIRAGELPTEAIDAVAHRIATFHAAALPAAGAVPFGDQLGDTLASLVAHARDPSGAAMLREALVRMHERCAQELAARAAAGFVRDGHGDLRAEHVVTTDPVQVIDCVEFDRGLREIDVGADLAFLVMDLERLGAADGARRLVTSYRACGGDPGSEELLELFCAYRACVRASVTALRAEQLTGDARDRAYADSDALQRLAWRYVWRSHEPLVLVVCGPPAAGKTTLATEIAELAGLPWINSDRVRKAIGGLEPHDHAGPGLYTPAISERVYSELGMRARGAAAGAVIDASCSRRSERRRLESALAPRRPVYVECSVGRALLEDRARRRMRDPQRESDAGPELARAVASRFEPLTEVPAERRVRVGTERPAATVAAAVEAALATRRAGARPALAASASSR